MSVEREVIDHAVGMVLFNVSNYPEEAMARLAGRDLGPLRAKVVDAVVIALARPVEGVTLTSEEAELAAPALRYAAAHHAAAAGASWHVLAAHLRALAARLEASS